MLRQGETIGLPWTIDETKPNAKHAPKESNRRRILEPHAIAAIRLLILTGARLREILHAKWEHVDFERGLILLPESQSGGMLLHAPQSPSSSPRSIASRCALELG